MVLRAWGCFPLQMEEARKRTLESDAARAAEVKARSAPGRPANGAQHEDDNVSSTSGASTERSQQSAAPTAHGRMEGPGKALLTPASMEGAMHSLNFEAGMCTAAIFPYRCH